MATPFEFADIASRTTNELARLGSEIRRVHLLGQEFRAKNPERDLIDLSLGNPDLEPPAEVKLALRDLVEDATPGRHRYMDNAGLPDVRAFVADELSRSEGVPLDAQSVFMTVGAAGALQIVLKTITDPGDEVILFAPYFSEYLPYVHHIGCKAVVVACDDRHIPDPDAFARAITPQTRAVIINSPNNPTGVVYPEPVLRALSDILRTHFERTGKLVHTISDEPYSRLLFGNAKPVSMLSLFDCCWLVRSHSKDLGLAGERIGYLAWGPRLARIEVLNALRNSARVLGFVNAPALMQRVLPRVFHAKVQVSEYEARVKTFVDMLHAAGMSCQRPGGGFFVFPRAPQSDDKTYCTRLLENGVLCVPGSGFGAPGFFRCSLTQPLARVEEAARRIIALG